MQLKTLEARLIQDKFPYFKLIKSKMHHHHHQAKKLQPYYNHAKITSA